MGAYETGEVSSERDDVRVFESGEDWLWCYTDEKLVSPICCAAPALDSTCKPVIAAAHRSQKEETSNG